MKSHRSKENTCTVGTLAACAFLCWPELRSGAEITGNGPTRHRQSCPANSHPNDRRGEAGDRLTLQQCIDIAPKEPSISAANIRERGCRPGGTGPVRVLSADKPVGQLQQILFPSRPTNGLRTVPGNAELTRNPRLRQNPPGAGPAPG